MYEKGLKPLKDNYLHGSVVVSEGQEHNWTNHLRDTDQKLLPLTTAFHQSVQLKVEKLEVLYFITFTSQLIVICPYGKQMHKKKLAKQDFFLSYGRATRS